MTFTAVHTPARVSHEDTSPDMAEFVRIRGYAIMTAQCPRCEALMQTTGQYVRLTWGFCGCDELPLLRTH